MENVAQVAQVETTEVETQTPEIEVIHAQDSSAWYGRFGDQGAITTAKWLDNRKAQHLPVATDRQLARADRQIAGNPMLRERFNTPLGRQQLALLVPLDRRERRELGLKPRTVRTGDVNEVSTPIHHVEAFLADHSEIVTQQDAALALAGMHGYSGAGLNHVLKRVDRYTNSKTARPCGHIRDKARLLDAIAKAVTIIGNRTAAQETVNAG